MDMFIDGRWAPAGSGAVFDIINPATGTVIDTAPEGDAGDADIAIRCAERAFLTWKMTPVAERASLQKRAAQLMRERAEPLGRVLTAELGRPLAGSISEIQRSAELLDVYAEEGVRVHAEMPLTGI